MSNAPGIILTAIHSGDSKYDSKWLCPYRFKHLLYPQCSEKEGARPWSKISPWEHPLVGRYSHSHNHKQKYFPYWSVHNEYSQLLFPYNTLTISHDVIVYENKYVLVLPSIATTLIYARPNRTNTIAGILDPVQGLTEGPFIYVFYFSSFYQVHLNQCNWWHE